MSPFYSLSPSGVPMRDPENVLIMKKSVEEHPDSERMEDETADFGITWWGNGYSRRNTWIVAEQKYVVSLEDTR